MPDKKDTGYLPLISDIVSSGFICVVFNFQGCGDAGGNCDMQGWYGNLMAVFHRIYNTPGVDPTSIHCIGFSAGGAVASRAVAMDPHISSLLLMATPQAFREILPDTPKVLKEHFVSIGIIRDSGFPDDLDAWYDTFTDLDAIKWLPFCAPRPVGIVHGDADEVVPLSHASILYEHAREPKKLIMLEGASHQLRKDERVSGIILDWLNGVV